MPWGSAGFIPAKTSTMTSQSASGDGQCAVMTYCAPISLSPCKTAWSPNQAVQQHCGADIGQRLMFLLAWLTELALLRRVHGFCPIFVYRSFLDGSLTPFSAPQPTSGASTCSRTANPRQQTSQGVRCVLDWRYQTLEVGTEGPVVVEDKTQILHQGSHFDLHSPHS
jgi:hypothetical protein